MSASAFLGSQQRFIRARAAHSVQIGAQFALFDESSQQLSALNDSAAMLWRALAQHASLSELAEALSGPQINVADAEEMVASLLLEWLRRGYITSTLATDQLERRAMDALTVAVGDLAAELRFLGTADAHAAKAAFAGIQAIASPHLRVDVVGAGGLDHIFIGGEPIGAAAPKMTTPRLKALLTKEYCRRTRSGFLAHGALLSRAGRTLFLSGAPGAGKTTLALALASRGFAYGGDDIVHINDDGLAIGVAFAAAAKSGSWRILSDYLPWLESAPIHEREDGVLVRYAAPDAIDRNGPRPIDAIALLDRQEGAAASLQSIEPIQALCAVLESGYSESRSLRARTLENFAGAMTRATCVRLVYEDVGGALAQIDQLMNE